jgi:histidinol-phosphate aminotransferase
MPSSRIKPGHMNPAVHGGIDYSEMSTIGINPDEILDFSTNCNPFGPPPGIKTAIRNADLESYPDSSSNELREALAGKLQVNKNNLIIGSGSTELIRLIAMAYLDNKDTAIINNPTYSEYETACQLTGCIIKKITLSPADNFRLDVRTTISQIIKHKANAIFLCNPNNPTGQYLTKNEVEQIIKADKNCLVVLDEAYIAFTGNTWPSLDLLKYDNLVIVRSMTKDFAIAGIRTGYAIASKEIISVLNEIKPPWNVSSIAQKAALYALNCDKYIQSCYRKIQNCRDYLVEELEKMGFTTLSSQTNFFLVRTGNAPDVRNALLKKGLLVRDCSSFGLPEYIRIAPRSMSQCRKLIKALKETGVHPHAG